MRASLCGWGVTAWMPDSHADHDLAWLHWGILCMS
jgi:hypothetical protein